MRWMLLCLSLLSAGSHAQAITVESLSRLRMQINTQTMEAMHAASDADARARELRSNGDHRAGMAEAEAERWRYHRRQLEAKLAEVEDALRRLRSP